MFAARKHQRQAINQLGTDVLVKEQLHATEFARRRSRAAANASVARISSRVRSGKSLRISSSVIPPARYSRMSYTVIRVPLIHGFPLRTDELTMIRSCQFIGEFYLLFGHVTNAGRESDLGEERRHSRRCASPIFRARIT